MSVRFEPEMQEDDITVKTPLLPAFPALTIVNVTPNEKVEV